MPHIFQDKVVRSRITRSALDLELDRADSQNSRPADLSWCAAVGGEGGAVFGVVAVAADDDPVPAAVGLVRPGVGVGVLASTA
jgi:hypothetical protein